MPTAEDTTIQVTNRGGLVPTTDVDVWRAAKACATTMSKRFKSQEEAYIAILAGLECGFTIIQAAKNVAVINGMPSLGGDGALAVVRRSGKLASVLDSPIEDSKGSLTGWTVTTMRSDANTPKTTRFTVDDAKKARLWGKQGPWSEYPGRMLYYRALAFNLRDQFSDVLSGLGIAEEVRDYNVVGDDAGAPAVGEIAPSDPDPVLAQLGIETVIDQPSGGVIDEGPIAAAEVAPVPSSPDVSIPLHDQAIAILSETGDVTQAAAHNVLRVRSNALYRKTFAKLNDEQLTDLIGKIKSGDVAVAL